MIISQKIKSIRLDTVLFRLWRDLFIADSNFVQKRIKTYYDRPSKVIFPPVDTDFFTPGPSERNDYYLLAGAMVPYKKGDIVIEAFNGLDKKLIVTGDGPDLKRLAEMATDNIEFTGWIDRETLRDYYRGCRALVFPGIEDFGITPVEAQACGRPVIAYGEGGLLDTVIGPTLNDCNSYSGFKSGIFFPEQTVNSIRSALDIFPNIDFEPDAIANHARRFSKKNFSNSISEVISIAYEDFHDNGKAGLEERIIT